MIALWRRRGKHAPAGCDLRSWDTPYGSTFFTAKYTCSGPGNLRLLTSAA